MSSAGIYTTSRHIPGVRFAGVSHPGLIGTAPSSELLATWNKREGELIAANEGVVPPVAYPPNAKGAYVGQELPDDVKKKVYLEGARTIPGREHGGNADVSFSPSSPHNRNADAFNLRSRTYLGRLSGLALESTALISALAARVATSQCLSRAQICRLVTCISPKGT